MKRHNLILLFLFISMCFQVSAKEHTELVEEPVYTAGEHLRYELFYNYRKVWISAGFADFQTRESTIDAQALYHIKVIGKTRKIFNLFYKVYDIYETYIDKKTRLPRRFIRDINEGGYKIDHQRDFFHQEGKVISKTEDFKTPRRLDTLSLPSDAQDLLSAIYLTRCADYKDYNQGDIFPLTIFMDNEIHQLGVKYFGKEQVETPLGNFNCIKAQPQVLEGRVFDQEDLTNIFIYVTDDDNRIPVLIEAPIKVGSVKALLVSYKGLKKPIQALIK